MGRLSVNLTSPHLKVGAWRGQERQSFKKWNNDKNVTFGSSTLLSSVGGSCINMRLLAFSRYVRKSSLRGQDTLSPPSCPSRDWQMMWETAGVSHVSFQEYFSNWATGPPIRPQEREGGSHRTRPDQTQLVWISPAPFGLITRPWSHRVLHHWGRSPPPREAEDDRA